MSAIDVLATLSRVCPTNVVDRLIEAYSELKRNYLLAKHRPNEVEGGRFAEAVFRLLEHVTTGRHTSLGQQLNTDGIIRTLSQLPATAHPDSVRLHIPRTLRVIYDIRNRRDAAHLADGIDPNLQDATLVTSCADWVLAELVRIYHGCSPTEAQAAIETIVCRSVPAVQEFGNRLKTLRPSLSLPQRILVILYRKGGDGARFDDISQAVKPSQQRHLRSTLWKLEHDRDLIVESDGLYYITRAGEQEVERSRLFEM